jgi:crotonobetainyl-CoA:carnitine CoA-transferase CaiB-like acyl-CoA transferase
MAGTLEGIRVIDMGHVVAVPAAGAMMGDWGAEVIKVEPLVGDMARWRKRYQGVDKVLRFAGGEVDWMIQLHNRNKKGLAIDLKTQPGRDILYKLVQKADVFMSNYELGSLKRLGADYATLSQLNPQIIYGVLTGYGTAGPDKDERGFDFSAAWARSGMQYLIGEPGSAPPPQRGGMMDRVAGSHIVAGILAALLHRERTGKGQQLEFSLYHSAVWTLAADIQAAAVGLPLAKFDRTKALSPLLNSYRTKDDRWFQLAMALTDTEWPNLCRAIARPELEHDSRFANAEARERHREALIRILDDVFASKSLHEWETYFREHHCIYGRIQSPLEVSTDPQALANGFFTTLHHPAGEMRIVTTPVTFRHNPASLRSPAPEVGQHTQEILLDLGYRQDDIVQLQQQGVIL